MGSSSHSASRPERIAQILQSRITGHELAAGSRLPSEKALATHFGVSRAAVREAIARLKSEGLVETLQGSGTYVRALQGSRQDHVDSLTRSSVESLLALIDVRRVTEAEIAARAAALRTNQQMTALDRAFQRLIEVEAEGGDGVAEDRAFHACIADASGNVYWRELTAVFSKHIAVAIAVTRVNEAMRRDFSVQVAAEHRELRDAILASDPERARAAAILHMKNAADRILTADRSFWKTDGARVVNLPPSR